MKKYDQVKKTMICLVDGVYATPISSCSSFNQLHEILRSTQQAEVMPRYPQEDIVTLHNKGSVTVSQKSEEGTVTNALRKDNMTRRNAGIKWGVTHHIQSARSKAQINALFPFKLKLKYGCKIGVLTRSSEKHCI